MENFKLIDNEVAKNIYEIDEQKIIANDRYIHTLTQKIIELACGIRDRYGYTSIHIKYKNGLEPDLTNQDWFKRNYYQMYHKLGNNFLNKMVQKIGMPYYSNTFEEFLGHKDLANREKIERYFYNETYKKLKGRYLEWYVAVLFMDKYKYIKKPTDRLVFSVEEPLEIRIRGEQRLFWFQKQLHGRSDLNCQPDFTISKRTENKLDDESVLGIIECKYVNNVQSDHIRKLFSIGLDLLSKFVVLVSFHEVNKNIKLSANKLGIEIQGIEENISSPTVISEDLDNFIDNELFINSNTLAMIRKSAY